MPERLSLSQIYTESKQARGILSLYEAALNMDTQAARNIFFEHRRDPMFRFYHYSLSDEFPEWDDDPDLIPRELWFALMCAGTSAKEMADKHCHQRCAPGPRDPSVPARDWTLYTHWRFDNLVGAMYLQAYWMMTSGEALIHCEYCSRVISLARPHPEGRKSRSDKRFCDDACRQAHHRSKKKT